MADRPGDRSASVSSSITEAEAYDENEKSHSPTDSSYVHTKTPEEMEAGDEERAELIPAAVHVVQEKATEPEKATVRSAVIWMVINTLATIGIVCPHLETIIINILITDRFPSRSSRIKPSSPIHPLSSPNSPLPPSISS